MKDRLFRFLVGSILGFGALAQSAPAQTSTIHSFFVEVRTNLNTGESRVLHATNLTPGLTGAELWRTREASRAGYFTREASFSLPPASICLQGKLAALSATDQNPAILPGVTINAQLYDHFLPPHLEYRNDLYGGAFFGSGNSFNIPPLSYRFDIWEPQEGLYSFDPTRRARFLAKAIGTFNSGNYLPNPNLHYQTVVFAGANLTESELRNPLAVEALQLIKNSPGGDSWVQQLLNWVCYAGGPPSPAPTTIVTAAPTVATPLASLGPIRLSTMRIE